MSTREFKYYPTDFATLPVQVLHMDLDFDVFDEHTDVLSTLHLQSKNIELQKIELNAKNLEIHRVECDISKVSYEYNKEQDLLIVSFETPIKENTTFTITTKTTCKPTHNILEGIYYDQTPKGAPPTQITQCQQWGFQRIVPCIDDMSAKCTYNTTIRADARYTNIISNGDPVGSKKDIGNGRVQVQFDNTITPMSTYLFFLGCGTYATFTREFEYPTGEKFMLELLVPPKSDEKIAQKALEMLHDAIMWIYVYTGAKRYENSQTRDTIWQKVQEREQCRRDNKECEALREELAALCKEIIFGYKYTGKVYREIGMQNSDFGGMENVGNTTITTNRIMPFTQMSDASFEYMIRVKLHEFYHNLNGSEVTGQSPFEIWLNEAVTVHIEREHHAFLFGEDYARLQQVIGILSPIRGTLTQDSAVASMPIEPKGFNDCNELITGITYVKAPEFIRMVQTTVGKERFNQGLYSYYARYKHSNATRAQWLEAIEDASGNDLADMAKGWLTKTHFPILQIDKEQKEGKVELHLTQTNVKNDDDAWKFPFICAIFDVEGKCIEEKQVFVDKKKKSIFFENIKEYGFISVHRGYSFYGKVLFSQTKQQLLEQVYYDTDPVARFMAWSSLFEKEIALLINEASKEVDSELVELYGKMLEDEQIMQKVGAQFYTIFESCDQEQYAHHYQRLFDARQKILRAIANTYEQELYELYEKYSQNDTTQEDYMASSVAAIKDRQCKNLVLRLLATLDTAKVHALLKSQIDESTNATDKVTAFKLYLNSTAKDRAKVLEKYEKEAATHLVSWEMFLYAIGGNDSDDYLELIKIVQQSPHFRIEQTNDQRGLFASFANNKKKSLETKEGRAFLEKIIVKLAHINEYTTGRLLNVFGSIDKMHEDHHVPLMQVLYNILEQTSLETTPSVHNTVKRIINGSSKAKKAHEKSKKE